jgi:transcriptional regulator with XRE-family HTH domain
MALGEASLERDVRGRAPTPARLRAASGVIGARLRARREGLGISLRQFARDLDVSPSFVSQLETGKAQPSVATLFMICEALEISVEELFAADDAGPARTDAANNSWVPVEAAGRPAAPAAGAPTLEAPLVHPDERRVLVLDSGVTWESLIATRSGRTDFMFVRYEVGGSSTLEDRLIRHSGTEYGYILRGELEVTLGFETYRMSAGDSISFDSARPHRLANVGDEPVEAIWVNLEYPGAGH